MRIPRLLPDDWRARAGEAGTQRAANVVGDYIAGMTDRYAMDEHRRLTDLSVSGLNCHCEERSDAATQSLGGLPRRCAPRNDEATGSSAMVHDIYAHMREGVLTALRAAVGEVRTRSPRVSR